MPSYVIFSGDSPLFRKVGDTSGVPNPFEKQSEDRGASFIVFTHSTAPLPFVTFVTSDPSFIPLFVVRMQPRESNGDSYLPSMESTVSTDFSLSDFSAGGHLCVTLEAGVREQI